MKRHTLYFRMYQGYGYIGDEAVPEDKLHDYQSDIELEDDDAIIFHDEHGCCLIRDGVMYVQSHFIEKSGVCFLLPNGTKGVTFDLLV